MNKTNKKDIQRFKAIWNKAQHKLNSLSWNKYGDELLKANLLESKSHDRFRGEDIKRGITIKEEAVFFAIKRLAEYTYNLEGYKPKAEDYNHVLKSIFIAYALADEYNKELKEIISLKDAQFLNKLDYCELIKGD